MTEFKGKTALVTGASRGIGAASAIALAEAGVARVLIHYGSHRPGAEQTLTAVRARGADGTILQGDLTTMEGTNRFLEALAADGARIDLLINNAGSLIKRSSLLDYTEELFDAIMNLNVKSLWFISKAVAPGMIAGGGGAIVNVSSIAARNGGGPGATIYAAAKAAVSAITKGMAKELAPKGIRVNAISPGTVDNHFHEVFSTREMLDYVVKQTPIGRLATNEEMADAVVYLCSSKASYVVGQTIELNGGMFMV
jgi:3-oxoacyl-[acyl-carrier protein] reductase